MIVTNHEGKPGAKMGYSIIFVLLAISFVVLGPVEAIAQGTNATNTTSPGAGGAGGQTTVVVQWILMLE